MNKTEKHTFQIQLADGNFLQVENNYWDPSHPAEVYISDKHPTGRDIQDIAYVGESYTKYNDSGKPIVDTPEAIKVMVYSDNEQEEPSFVKKIMVRK